jgi:hypothetical protein
MSDSFLARAARAAADGTTLRVTTGDLAAIFAAGFALAALLIATSDLAYWALFGRP